MLTNLTLVCYSIYSLPEVPYNKIVLGNIFKLNGILNLIKD